MRGLFPSAVTAAVALALGSTVVMAQETTSSIRGNVTTPEGITVEGASVTIVHMPSGTTSTALTGSSGAFSASGLRPGGPYKVTVVADEIGSSTIDGIYLGVGEPIDLPLTVGIVELDEITVSSGRQVAMVTGPTTTIDRKGIEGVASVQRDIRDIVRRDPYASFNPSSRGVSIAGTNNRTNRFAVDGLRFSDNFGLQQGGLPTSRGPVPLDAVEQMSVKIAPFDISEGDFQGGSINLVLRSGDNDFTGSAFYTYASDGLTGDKTRGQDVSLDFTSKNWGMYFAGPLIKNRLFFALSYEELDEGNPASVGLAGAPSVVPNLSEVQVGEVAGTAESVYGYGAAGLGLRTTLPETDRKITGKVDWNITEQQRLSYTGIFQKGYMQSSSTGSSSAAAPALYFNGYGTNEPEHVNSHALQLNSRWTNDFSTEARLNYRDYDKIPSSLGTAGFGQFTVCLDEFDTGNIASCSNGTPTLRFGTEQYSQADVVAQKQYGFELTGRYDMGDHQIKALASYSALEVTNMFVHSSLGLFYFDSLESFRNRQASTLSWQYSIGPAATTGTSHLDRLKDVEASFGYDQITLGLQDSWNVIPGLNVTYGLRLDTYKMSDKPPENQFFVDRYGFTNTYNLDGLSVLQPRISASWRAAPNLRLRAGFGLFNGGGPDVFVGNSFSVAGVYGNTLSGIQRSADGCTLAGAALPADVCAEALDNVAGNDLTSRTALYNYLATNTGALEAAPVNAMQKDFKLPSIWKANLSAEYFADLGRLGTDWTFGLDLLQSWTKDAAYYTDLRIQPSGNFAPDGRPIYESLTGGNNSDLLMANTGKGKSTMVVARVSKSWDSGLSAGLSYAWQDVDSLSDMGTAASGGTTAAGTYGDQLAGLDFKVPEYGTSSYEVRHNLKLNLDYSKAFFGTYQTRFSLFAETRTGTPYSLRMNSNIGSTPIWGPGNNRALLYVPDVSAFDADPAVTYDSVATYEAFRDYVVANGLEQGKIVKRNSKRMSSFTKVDLHMEQELPGFMEGTRFKVFFDMENLLNALNDKWGSYRTFSSAESIVDVTCGGAPAGTCPQYVYSGFREPNPSTSSRVSLWSARLGFRVEF
jgi:hypothetical protein